jgi:hypothetical protein
MRRNRLLQRNNAATLIAWGAASRPAQTRNPEMSPRNDYPEFSNIRSHIERADAQRSFAAGVVLADTLLLAGEMLRRAVASVLGVFSRSAKRVSRPLEG